MISSLLFSAASILQVDAVAEPEISSETDLRVHLCSDITSPLDAMMPTQRRRFLESLIFGESGLGGFSYEPLRELSPGAALAVLDLFGARDYAVLFLDEDEQRAEPSTTLSDRRGSKAPSAYCSGEQDRKAWLANAPDITPEERAVAMLSDKLADIDDAAAAEPIGRDWQAERREAYQRWRRDNNVSAIARQADDAVLDRLSWAVRAYAGMTGDEVAIADEVPIQAEKQRRGVTVEVERADESENATLAPKPTTKPIDFDGVVIVGSPGCHFSIGASNAIAADPSLLARMAKNALWLLPPLEDGKSSSVAMWNEDHPRMAFASAEKPADWPEIATWRTPSFYFYKNGALVDAMIGWEHGKDEARKERLRQGLSKTE